MTPEDGDSGQEKNFSRRVLLQSGLGAITVPCLTGGTGSTRSDQAVKPTAAPEPTLSTESSAKSQQTSDDALSVREAAKWIDRRNSPRRLRGNGPPFADRDSVTQQQKAKFDGMKTMFHPEKFVNASYDTGMMFRTDDRNGAVPLCSMENRYYRNVAT